LPIHQSGPGWLRWSSSLVLGIDNLVFIAILAEKLPLPSATARA
jgi:hypothetical protein